MDQRHKILIADDEPINIMLLQRVLEKEYLVFTAYSGPEAIEIATRENPDLILLDVMMPQMDGFETCSRLKSISATRRIPVIFITAVLDATSQAQGLELGAVDYITKPINIQLTVTRIHNHMALKLHMDMLEYINNELDIKNRQLEVLSRQDGLTGLANRRYFDEALETELRRAAREAKPLTLLLCDIDRFKHYNDEYGHLAGDDCLRSIAGIMGRVFRRSGETIARYGGEEFAIILPNTSYDLAGQLAETLRRQVQSEDMPQSVCSEAPHLTISIGAVTLENCLGVTPEWLTGMADKALFESKHGGRNLVTSRHVGLDDAADDHGGPGQATSRPASVQ